MLDQLVESKNHKDETARKSGFIVTTLGVLVAVLVSGWTYSLFAKNYGMSGDFELSSIVAPVAAVEDAPPPKPDIKPERTTAAPSNKIILRELYDDVSSPKLPPKDTRGEKDVISARKFNLENVERGPINQIPQGPVGRMPDGDSKDCGLCQQPDDDRKIDKPEEKIPELKIKPTPQPTAATPKPAKSLGVVNGIATSLVKPSYPAPARSVRAEGDVNVQVTIDEKGNVISAVAASGHPLLRAAAVSAARQSRFTPTKLSGEPVKVTGIIIYKFSL